MITFLDGPARGQHLMLRRAPMFLRVTESGGTFDGLDQLEDTPRPDEKVYAYRIEGEATWCHVRISGGRGGIYKIADYRFVTEQPSDAAIRDAAKWTEWVMSQPEAKALLAKREKQ